jgi:hypothetical protein
LPSHPPRAHKDERRGKAEGVLPVSDAISRNRKGRCIYSGQICRSPISYVRKLGAGYADVRLVEWVERDEMTNLWGNAKDETTVVWRLMQDGWKRKGDKVRYGGKKVEEMRPILGLVWE